MTTTTRGNAIVTGTSSGFGRLITETLARAGYTVYAGMRDLAGRNAEHRVSLGQLAEKEGLHIRVVELDVESDASVEAAVAHVASETGGAIDVLVNNAGLSGIGVAEAFTVDQVKKLFDVNVIGLYRMTRAVLPHMRRAGRGVVVNLSSQIGRISMPAMAPYCATKFAVEGLSEGMRYELAPLGVEVVVVQPGAYPTELGNKSVYASDQARIAEYGPIGELPQKMGEGLAAMFASPNAPRPQEVADAVLKALDAPAGHRPFRTAVGGYTAPFEQINDVNDRISREVLSGFGMAALVERLPPRS